MIALSLLLKVSLVVAATAALQRLLERRASAASRHLWLTLAIAGVLLLPVLSTALPAWTAVTWTSADNVSAAPTAAVPAQSSPQPRIELRLARPAVEYSQPSIPALVPSTNWLGVLLAIYSVGVIVLAGRLVAERLALRSAVSRAAPITDPTWTGLADHCTAVLGIRRPVRMLRSAEQTMPMTIGLWRSVVLLPRDSDEWTMDRRRAVLLHELAHVARFDCLTQFIAACATALYWPHPGVWWLAQRLRVERELACDDCVLASGSDARDYAGHLLDLAYQLSNARTPALAMPMAGARQLEGRMLAVLDETRHRAAPAGRSRLAAVVLMIAIVCPIAGVTAKASPARQRGDVAGGAALSSAEPQSASSDKRQRTWELRLGRESGVVHLTWSNGASRDSQRLQASELIGLTLAQLADARGPVRFSLRREAGTFNFDGVARDGAAAGTFDFAPDSSFPERLAKRGLRRPTPAQQLLLARQDIGIRFIDQLTASKQAPPTIELLTRAAENGVDAAFVDGLHALGYRALDLEQLITLRKSGVDPDYVGGLGQAGHRNLTPEQLLRLRNRGIDSGYIRELAAVGHGSLTLDQLVDLRNRGVDAGYIARLTEAGHRNLSLEQLLRLRHHGIDGDYVRELAGLGHAPLSSDELIRLRSHGIDADYVRDLAGVGYRGLSLQQLVELRQHGVDADYIREVSAASNQKLSVQALIELRKKGV